MKLKQSVKHLSGVSGVYEIRCIVSNKFYVGSAVDLRARRSDHGKALRGNRHRNRHLQNAWNKYGESSFVFSVLEFVKDKEKLIEREQHYIDTSNPEYNIARVAGSCLGYRHTEEAKMKVSKANKGRVFSEDILKKKRSVMRDIITKNIGVPRSESTKEKLRKAMTGRVMSEETKNKIRRANTGRVVSEETCRKLHVLGCCRVHSDETKRKLSIARSKPVVQLTLSGDFVAEFPSISSAMGSGFRAQYVQECVKGRLSSYKGYMFVYKEGFPT